jgi:colanic acid biosynthesis glycosyl transferase WcaI
VRGVVRSHPRDRTKGAVTTLSGNDVRSRDRRPRILVLNEYYWPGIEATAHLLTELCEALATDFDVTVVTGTHAEAGGARRALRNGVEVIRVPSTSFARRRLLLRAFNYLTYVTSALAAGLAARPPDVVLCMTDPPFLGAVAKVIARRFRVPLVVIAQDVFPEIAVAVGRLGNPAVVGLLRILVNYYLRRADRVVAIGDTMRRRLEEKSVAPERLVVIPNWVDTAAVAPRPRDNAWARGQGLVDRFVAMHSGNIGHAQNLDVLVQAATLLQDLEDLTVLIVGGGARQAELVGLAERLDATSVRFLPYQPREVLSESLSTADVHVIGLAKGLAGYIVPSRLYGTLAVARPVIVAAEAESETAQLVQRVRCGIVLPPGRPELLASAIRRAYKGELDLEAMGRRGRAYVEAEANRQVAVGRYRSLLLDVTAR